MAKPRYPIAAPDPSGYRPLTLREAMDAAIAHRAGANHGVAHVSMDWGSYAAGHRAAFPGQPVSPTGYVDQHGMHLVLLNDSVIRPGAPAPPPRGADDYDGWLRANTTTPQGDVLDVARRHPDIAPDGVSALPDLSPGGTGAHTLSASGPIPPNDPRVAPTLPAVPGAERVNPYAPTQPPPVVTQHSDVPARSGQTLSGVGAPESGDVHTRATVQIPPNDPRVAPTLPAVPGAERVNPYAPTQPPPVVTQHSDVPARSGQTLSGVGAPEPPDVPARTGQTLTGVGAAEAGDVHTRSTVQNLPNDARVAAAPPAPPAPPHSFSQVGPEGYRVLTPRETADAYAALGAGLNDNLKNATPKFEFYQHEHLMAHPGRPLPMTGYVDNAGVHYFMVPGGRIAHPDAPPPPARFSTEPDREFHESADYKAWIEQHTSPAPRSDLVDVGLRNPGIVPQGVHVAPDADAFRRQYFEEQVWQAGSRRERAGLDELRTTDHARYDQRIDEIAHSRGVRPDVDPPGAFYTHDRALVAPPGTIVGPEHGGGGTPDAGQPGSPTDPAHAPDGAAHAHDPTAAQHSSAAAGAEPRTPHQAHASTVSGGERTAAAAAPSGAHAADAAVHAGADAAAHSASTATHSASTATHSASTATHSASTAIHGAEAMAARTASTAAHGAVHSLTSSVVRTGLHAVASETGGAMAFAAVEYGIERLDQHAQQVIRGQTDPLVHREVSQAAQQIETRRADVLHGARPGEPMFAAVTITLRPETHVVPGIANPYGGPTPNLIHTGNWTAHTSEPSYTNSPPQAGRTDATSSVERLNAVPGEQVVRVVYPLNREAADMMAAERGIEAAAPHHEVSAVERVVNWTTAGDVVNALLPDRQFDDTARNAARAVSNDVITHQIPSQSAEIARLGNASGQPGATPVWAYTTITVRSVHDWRDMALMAVAGPLVRNYLNHDNVTVTSGPVQLTTQRPDVRVTENRVREEVTIVMRWPANDAARAHEDSELGGNDAAGAEGGAAPPDMTISQADIDADARTHPPEAAGSLAGPGSAGTEPAADMTITRREVDAAEGRQHVGDKTTTRTEAEAAERRQPVADMTITQDEIDAHGRAHPADVTGSPAGADAAARLHPAQPQPGHEKDAAGAARPDGASFVEHATGVASAQPAAGSGEPDWVAAANQHTRGVDPEPEHATGHQIPHPKQPQHEANDQLDDMAEGNPT